MDIYIEHIVKHKNNAKDIMPIVGIILAGVLVTVLLILFYRYTFGFGFFLIAALWYFEYIYLRTRRIEFEYIMTNSAMDIDKILSKSGRKPVISFDFKDIEVCAPVDCPETAHIYKNTEGITKTIDALGNPEDGGVYFVDMAAEDGRVRILFQPKPEMIEEAKRFNPRQIYI